MTDDKNIDDVTDVTDRARACVIFLENLALRCNVSESARKAGVTRKTFYEWKKEDEEFAAAWEEALAQGKDVIRGAVWERGVDGIKVPIVSRKTGEIVGYRTEYSDKMLEILAKGHCEELKDKKEIDLKNSDGSLQIYLPANGREITEDGEETT